MTDDDFDLTRRTLGKLTLAGLGGLGLSGTGQAASSAYDPTFRNWRAREASRVWDRGYRGRPDRTVAITDSGVEARHPDLGPWNGVRAETRNGEVVIPKSERERNPADAPNTTVSGAAGPGTFADPDRNFHEFTTPDGVEEIEATMTWTPEDVQDNGEDLELFLDRKTADGWERVAAATSGSQPEIVVNYVEPDTRYRFVVETWLNVTAEYEIVGEYYVYEGEFEAADPSVVFEDAGSGNGAAKTVGWFDAGARYGSFDEPRDPNGHGSHCSSIMAGTGRATAIDTDSVTTEEPGEILLAGDTREYEVTADAGTNVFASVYGTAVEVVIEGPDGREVDSTSITSDSAVNEHAISEGAAQTDGTYTVIVRPVDGLDVTSRVDAVSVGHTEDPNTTNGDRSGTPTGLHTGVAPDQSIFGLQGLSGPTAELAKYAESFTDLFNIRAVNMSWGYVGGLPLGSVGGGNGSPEVADEAVSVCATGAYDGLTAYSSGGIGALDEDENETYMKPDVAAPGGKIDDVVNAAKTGKANTPESDQSPIRDYTGKAGTSMATPFTTGVTGLLAQAMEEDAPASIALPAPDETDFDDTMRL
ncbi:MAG: S8 family serine peptidase, partial [Halobaculum sp.]